MEPSAPRDTERDHQLSIWANEPRRVGPASSLEHTSLRIDKDDLRVLREMADANGLSLATLIRNIIHAWIAEGGHGGRLPAPPDEEALALRIAQLVAERLAPHRGNMPRI